MTRLRWCKRCFARLAPDAGPRRLWCDDCKPAVEAEQERARYWRSEAKRAAARRNAATRYAAHADELRAYQRDYHYRVAKPRACGLAPEAA